MQLGRTSLGRVYTVGFVFALTIAFTAYINSSFLSDALPGQTIGLLFSIAALLTLVSIETIPAVLRRFGARTTILACMGASILSLGIFASTSDPRVIGAFFAIYLTANSLTIYCLDIFIEHYSKNTAAGSARGAYLTIINLAWMLSPLAAGILVATHGFQTLYAVVLGIAIMAIAFVLLFFRHFKDHPYDRPSPLAALAYVRKHPGIARIILVNFALQFFYAWMVIFTPIYLHEVVGFDFKTIGIIFTVMLAPFIILQYPLGRIADRGFGEKRILIAGLIVMILSTAAFAGWGGMSILLAAITLFFTRVGASTVEVMTETYFFKQMNDREANIISLFRTTYPAAYIVAPIIAAVVLPYIGYTGLFFSLAGFLILALIIAIPIREIKR